MFSAVYSKSTNLDFRGLNFPQFQTLQNNLENYLNFHIYLIQSMYLTFSFMVKNVKSVTKTLKWAKRTKRAKQVDFFLLESIVDLLSIQIQKKKSSKKQG